MREVDITEAVQTILNCESNMDTCPDTLFINAQPQKYKLPLEASLSGCLIREGYDMDLLSLSEKGIVYNKEAFLVKRVVEYSLREEIKPPRIPSKLRSFILYSQPILSRSNGELIVFISKLDSGKSSAIYFCRYREIGDKMKFAGCRCGVNPF